MEILWSLLTILHFIGLASLLGSFLVQMKDISRGQGKILPGMFHGALTMLVTALGFFAVGMAADYELNHMKLGIKFLILLIITALVIVFRKKETAPKWTLFAIGGLTLANVIIAVAWHS
ncbi:hypothetical protein [Pseudoclavibacter albus]|uniref:hypothetical protein n=1 Tax=Pseudoclavibacter albus TaxID=272241 RepID=UPI0008265837|nr:hypothetical protein [Pseudoclavibacter alba]